MRRVGLPRASVLTQATREPSTSQGFAPLPPPTGLPPFRVTSADLELPAATKRAVHFCGDSGGVVDPHPQNVVVHALQQDLIDHPEVGCLYHLGDIGYFEGEQSAYERQLFEPYAYYNRHIMGIPGNHDGAGYDELKNFSRYLCDPHPKLCPEVEEYNRDTMNQPNCYWTWEDPAVTIIGLYSNVPSGGVIREDQIEWLVGELENASHGVPLCIALHHPPISVDAHHGGSAVMGRILDEAFEKAKRWPEIVLSGHVHNYQRFTRKLNGEHILYIVCGNSGYHNLHGLASDATMGQEVLPNVILNAGDDQNWGFLRLTFEGPSFSGEYTAVGRSGAVHPGADRFSGTMV